MTNETYRGVLESLSPQFVCRYGGAGLRPTRKSMDQSPKKLVENADSGRCTSLPQQHREVRIIHGSQRLDNRNYFVSKGLTEPKHCPTFKLMSQVSSTTSARCHKKEHRSTRVYHYNLDLNIRARVSRIVMEMCLFRSFRWTLGDRLSLAAPLRGAPGCPASFRSI